MLPFDLRKYFTLGLIILFLSSTGAAIAYRASYRIEQSKRAELEVSLKQTSDALAELSKSSAAALDAVTRASNATRAIAEDRRTQRERALIAPNEKDGPVSAILRDAVNSVR